MQGEVSWMLLIDQWPVSRHHTTYSTTWVWLLMQLQFRVLLSVPLLNIWPTTIILKRHLNFMVDPPGSKHTHTAWSKKKRGISLVLRVFLLPVQPLGNEVREEDRRDCMKGHDRVIDPKYDQHPASNLVITSNFVHCRRRPTVSLPLMRWFPNKQMKSVRFLADKFSHKVCYMSNSVLACCPVSYLGQKMLG